MKFKKGMKIFVNLITTSRLIASLILIILSPKLKELLFLILAAILFLTDLVDGLLARKFKVQTLYGATMDTIADKVLNIVLIIPLLSKINLIILILIGELVTAILNTYGKLKGKHTKSSMIGKIKMWFLAIAILLSYTYLFKYIQIPLVIISIISTFIIQTYTIIEYYNYLKKQKSIKKSKITTISNAIYILFDTTYYNENIKKLDNQL